jgi:hypothetical protein
MLPDAKNNDMSPDTRTGSWKNLTQHGVQLLTKFLGTHEIILPTLEHSVKTCENVNNYSLGKSRDN